MSTGKGRFTLTLDATPMGTLRLWSDGQSLTAIDFREENASGETRPDLPVLQQAVAELREYFAGTREEFTVALAPTGTPFQQRVWSELLRIPFGTTISYGELARRIGQPTASRAVGLANGQNPLPIIVPCHRVIGSTGKLTGYGGGIENKRWLLQHESEGRWRKATSAS